MRPRVSRLRVDPETQKKEQNGGLSEEKKGPMKMSERLKRIRPVSHTDCPLKSPSGSGTGGPVVTSLTLFLFYS